MRSSPPRDLEGLADIVRDELETRVIGQRTDVGQMAGLQVIDADDPVTTLEEPVAKVRPDKTGSAGHQDVEHRVSHRLLRADLKVQTRSG